MLKVNNFFSNHSYDNINDGVLIKRRQYQKTIDTIQASLEQETRSKQEVLKGRKKLEADINEYEVALEIANRNNQEGQKLVKKLQTQVKVRRPPPPLSPNRYP